MIKKVSLIIAVISILLASGTIMSNYDRQESKEDLNEKLSYVTKNDINFKLETVKNKEKSENVSKVLKNKDVKDENKTKKSSIVAEKNNNKESNKSNKNNENSTTISKNNSNHQNIVKPNNQNNAETNTQQTISKGKSVYLTNKNDTRKLSQESQRFYDIIMNTNGTYKCEYGWDEWDLVYNEFRNLYGQISFSQQKNFRTGAIELTINCDISKDNFKYITDYNNRVYNALKNAGVYDGMSEYDAIVAINNYICKITTYDLNYSVADDILKYGKGKCSAYASLMQIMCNQVNITCEQVIGTANGKNGWGSHAWNRVCLNGQWYYIDACWNDGTNNHYMFNKNLWSDHKL